MKACIIQIDLQEVPPQPSDAAQTMPGLYCAAEYMREMEPRHLVAAAFKGVKAGR